MVETDKPDAATEEQQAEEEKSQRQKKLAKKGHRSNHRLGQRVSANRRFRGKRGLQMMKGGFGRMLPSQLAKLLIEGQH